MALASEALDVTYLVGIRGGVDDEDFCLELLVVVGRQLEDVVGCLELDLSLVLGVARVVEGVVEVVEA